MLANTEALRAAYRNVWVVAEVTGGKVQKVTWELLGAARKLADARGSELWCVALGDGVSTEAAAIHGYGADVALLVDDSRLARFDDEAEAAALVRLIEKHKPEILVCAATTRGRALIPRVAVTATCGLTADCTGLAIDPENGDLLQTRPAFGGNIMATIRSSNHRPQLATVRPRVMNALEFDPGRKGRTISEGLLAGESGAFKTVLEVFHDQENAVNLSDARFIVAGGRGVKGREGFKLLKKLADAVGGAVGASRAAVDAGWVPYNHQVGQTGQTVQSTVYVACGISGQIQHLVGMQSCDYIVAIDKDPDTPMMKLADTAVVGDLYEIIPAMLAELAKT
jgi:electron transfer flavoprotein alpha subunit